MAQKQAQIHPDNPRRAIGSLSSPNEERAGVRSLFRSCPQLDHFSAKPPPAPRIFELRRPGGSIDVAFMSKNQPADH